MTRPVQTAAEDLPRPSAATDGFLRGFVGSAVLLLAIDLSERLLFGDGYFSSLAWHPFWIVILLAAVQHGLFVGLSVVGLATMLMDWPTRPVGVDITKHYGDIATVPVQWLVIALLIGLYRQQQLARERSLIRERDRLREVNLVLAGEIHRLDAFVARAELAAATGMPGADPHVASEALGHPVLALVPEEPDGGDRDPGESDPAPEAPEDDRLPADRASVTQSAQAVHG